MGIPLSAQRDIDEVWNAPTRGEQREATPTYTLVDVATGKTFSGTLTPEIQQRIADGDLMLETGETARMTTARGDVIDVAAEDVQGAQAAGHGLLSPDAERRERYEGTLEEAYGDRPGTAFVHGLGRGLTLGGTDVLAEGLGYGEAFREVQQRSPTAAIAGELTGVVAPALVTGGTTAPLAAGRGALGAGRLARAGIGARRILGATPAGLVARGSEAIVARGVGKGLAARALSRGAAGVAEGALYGAGQGVSELALSSDPVTMESIMAVLPSRALYGAKLGGIIGAGAPVVGAALGKGLRSARRMTDDVAGALRKGSAEVPEELARLDRAGLRAAKEVEELAAGEVFANDAMAYRALHDDVNPWLVAPTKTIKSDMNVVKKTWWHTRRNPTKLAREPKNLVNTLETEARIYREILDQGDDLRRTIQGEDAKLLYGLSKYKDRASLGNTSALGRKYKDHYNIPTQKGVKTVELDAADIKKFRKALESGEIRGARLRTLDRMPELLDANLALQARFNLKKTAIKSPRLDEIARAGDALAEGGGGGVIGAIVKAIPGGPTIGRLKNLVTDRMAKAGATVANRTGKAIDAIANVSSKASRISRPTATKLLQRVAYAPEASRSSSARALVPAASTLHGAYREREAELQAQTMPGPEGSPIMKPRARKAIADELQGVASIDPVVADQMETLAARRVEFLASKLARRPDIMALPMGPDNWRPSDMDMASFARSAAAVEDPISVLERAVDGSVTPEDAEALRVVYPELFAQTRASVMGQLPQLQETLPYERRLALSILYGVAVDPSMDPRVLRVLQGNFDREPGTEGGTAAPMPQPQFGSVSRPDPTPAQDRAVGRSQ